MGKFSKLESIKAELFIIYVAENFIGTLHMYLYGILKVLTNLTYNKNLCLGGNVLSKLAYQ